MEGFAIGSVQWNHNRAFEPNYAKDQAVAATDLPCEKPPTATRLDLYAQHGRELVGCKSPVRRRDSTKKQYAKCFLLGEVQVEGTCGRAMDKSL